MNDLHRSFSISNKKTVRDNFMNKKYIFFAIICVLCTWIFSFFYSMSGFNYTFHKSIQKNIVEHPEWLPTLDIAKSTSFGFQNVKADWYRLETIQYIGSNAIGSEYKKYLYKVLVLVTGLNPYFEHPYIIGELLLPSSNERYEKIEDSEKSRNLIEGEKLGLLWIKNFCDKEKITKIKNQYNLPKIWEDPYFHDTCKSYEIPFYLAYIYYFYKHDPLTSSWYYRIASASKDAPLWAKIMSAIMQGKWWEREKSIFMFLNLAKNFEKDDKACQKFVSWLGDLATMVQDKKIPLDGNTIKKLDTVRTEILWEFDEKEDQKFTDTSCKNYANKAVREFNLMYIEQGNEKFKAKNWGRNAINAKALFSEWFLTYLPIDYQQYKDYGIIYEFNPDTQRFDYDMWTYH